MVDLSPQSFWASVSVLVKWGEDQTTYSLKLHSASNFSHVPQFPDSPKKRLLDFRGNLMLEF